MAPSQPPQAMVELPADHPSHRRRARARVAVVVAAVLAAALAAGVALDRARQPRPGAAPPGKAGAAMESYAMR